MNNDITRTCKLPIYNNNTYLCQLLNNNGKTNISYQLMMKWQISANN